MRLGKRAASAVVMGAVAVSVAFAEVREVDLLVRNGTVVTLDAARRVLADGAVAVSGGRIVAVGTEGDVARGHRGREVLDAGGGIVLPGLVNAHTHAPMVLFRGIADDLRLMEWLETYIFPAEARNVTAEFVRAGTRLAALEMIRSGTTTFADMYYFEDEVAEAAREAGIRAVAGETWIDFPAPDNKTRAEAEAYTERFIGKWKGHSLVVPAIAPHSTYLGGPETLRAAKAMADRHGVPLLIHLQESEDEQRQIRERYGKTSTEHLRDLGLLRKGLLGAHGIWLSPSDRAILKAHEVGVAHCPQSNMKLASGAAPVTAMLQEGLRLGLGTDGAASNNDLDMFEEMLTAALLAKHATGDPTSAPAASVLEMATLGGARALGLDGVLGSLEPGKRADLVVVDTRDPRLQPLYDPVSHLVYAAKGADVRHSVIEGRVVMRDRRVLTLDADAVVSEARRFRDRILASLGRRTAAVTAPPLVGVKVYETDRQAEGLFQEWKDLGIDTVFASAALNRDPAFREHARRTGVRRFVILPIFFDPEALDAEPDLAAVTASGDPAVEEWVRFACPSRDGFRNRKIEWVKALVRETDPDGISIDFIRHFVFWEKVYPDRAPKTLPRTCFDRSCLAAFQEATGTRIPPDVGTAPRAAAWIEAHAREAWIRWRSELVTRMAREIADAARALEPGIAVSLHVVPWRREDFGGALREVAGQDVSALARHADYLSPMTYAPMVKRDAAWIHSVVDDLSAQASVPVLPSIQVGKAYLDTPVTVEEFAANLEAALAAPSRGVVFWSWQALEEEPEKKAVVKDGVGRLRR